MYSSTYSTGSAILGIFYAQHAFGSAGGMTALVLVPSLLCFCTSAFPLQLSEGESDDFPKEAKQTVAGPDASPALHQKTAHTARNDPVILRLCQTTMLGKTEGSRRRGRPRTRWSDSMKEARGTSLQELSGAVEDRTWWPSFTHRGARSRTESMARNTPTSSSSPGLPILWRFGCRSWTEALGEMMPLMGHLSPVQVPSSCT